MNDRVRRLIFPSAFAELRAIAASMSGYPTLRRAIVALLRRGPALAEDAARGFRVSAADETNPPERCLVLLELADLLDEWAEEDRVRRRFERARAARETEAA